MANPTANDLQPVDQILTGMLVAYRNEDSRFIASRLFPPVSVDKDSGTYFIFTKKYWFLDEAEERAYGADYPIGEYGVSTTTYATIQYALAKMIAQEERANSQLPMDLESAAIRWLAHQNLIRHERSFAGDFFTSSVWETDTSVTNKWSDYAASDPVADVRTGKRTISQSTGMYPNVLAMGEIVLDRLSNHPDIIDRIKYNQVATANSVEAALAAIFGVDQVLVGAAIYNSVNEGQTGTYTAIFDDDALLLYVTPNPGLFEASGGYCFNWAPGGGMGGVMPMIRDEKRDADMIKAKTQFDYKAVATDLGYFMPDCVD